jgi:hypothetical protein
VEEEEKGEVGGEGKGGNKIFYLKAKEK